MIQLERPLKSKLIIETISVNVYIVNMIFRLFNQIVGRKVTEEVCAIKSDKFYLCTVEFVYREFKQNGGECKNEILTNFS